MSAHQFRRLLRDETLYVLQNTSLMEQIERSLKTHGEGKGYRPSPEELDALDRV
jgi:antitoxin YefM